MHLHNPVVSNGHSRDALPQQEQLESDKSMQPQEDAYTQEHGFVHASPVNQVDLNQIESKADAEYPPMIGFDNSISQSAQESQVTAGHLLKRTPNNYLFNQAYGFWFYISSFLFIALITREVAPRQYGIYSIIQTTLNTLLYIIALGIEDATATYVPRTLAEYGQAAAGYLSRYLLLFRTAILILSALVVLFGLPVLASTIALIPISGTQTIANSLRNPVLQTYNIPIALYVLGTGLSNLLATLSTSQMRSYIILVLGSVSQLALLGVGFVLLHLGWGITSILWLQAIVSLLTAAGYALWQLPFILKGFQKKPGSSSPSYKIPVKGILQLSASAWITNIASGALLKQISIILLGLFAVSLTQIGYFNLSFQLADSANTLLVAGFSGVGGSALAIAFVGQNHERLGRSWQALIKVETLLAAPGLVFCLFNAQNIALVLYGSKYSPVGPLLAIFLFFNLLVRILGTTIHQASLYVVGKPQRVVISQWVGIVVIILAGIFFVPSMGAAGALLADGLAKTVTGALLLIFLLRDIPKFYKKELLFFTLRILAALILAALPWVLWHPHDRLLLGVSGVIFVALCIILLLWIKPLSNADMDMLYTLNPRIAKYLRYFARNSVQS